MTNLKSRLVDLIEANGPMDVATYMRLCLSDPTHGYYTTSQSIGRDGDFITAPEISQIFGEMIAIWVIDIWQKLGSPASFTLLEAGPGRGTLMADVLRTITKLSIDMVPGINVMLMEVSPILKARQGEALSPFGVSVEWFDSMDALGNAPADGPVIAIANEFLDALPIRQFHHQGGVWSERAIGLSDDKSLCWGLKPADFEPPIAQDPQEGAVFEVCRDAQSVVATLSRTLHARGGAALFIDYGHSQSGFGDTFQAMRRHAFVDPLEEPGNVDLTAHVDFAPLCAIAREAGLGVSMTTQGAFLIAMGLLERAGSLGDGQGKERQESIQIDVERLAAPDKMGNLFKVMALSAGDFTPHGFD